MQTETAEVFLPFPAELVEFINIWKDKPGNLIMILHKIQEHYRYIPRQAALALSEMIDVPLSKIYGVVTFYHLFSLKKPGKYKISVCLGTACYLRGGQDLIEEFEKQLGVGLNTVTADGRFSVEAVRCIGCCGLAPVMNIAGKVYGSVKTQDLKGILDQYK